jgi:alkanesulfonate monooxygenase SsuD/methylene tetrahydromethanopterin reductase-like flavin-dependent oxidoreductase (luciferase family)
MRFSLFFEMQISEPTRAAEHRLFRDSVAHAVLADALGYHGVWAAEHHGLYEYAHSSAPEIFLAHLSGRTKRIRLGHGVTLTPHRYNHPIRIAERVAALDILSEGRVDWGSGKSGSRVEQDAFGNDPADLHDQWLEALRMIPRMWQQDVFEWHSERYDIPPIQVVPNPVQQPHPPMFAACTNPKTAELAGSLGLGALNFAAGTDAELTDKVRRYREQHAAAEPDGYQKTERYVCTPTALVLDDDRLACRHGFRGSRFFWEAMQQYYAYKDRPVGRLPIGRDDLDEEELTTLMARRSAADSALTGVIGDPSAARETVARFAAAGVDELAMVMQVGTVPSELVTTSIRLFAEKVMPDFAD